MAATRSNQPSYDLEYTESKPALHLDDEQTDIIDSGMKPVRLSLHLIVKRHLPKDASDWPQDKIISELNKIKRVRLDRENIGEIDSLELFSTQVTNLYLQSNKISSIQNLECLPNLQVLALSNNKISEVSGLNHLEKLIFLDLSENCLQNVDCEELPKNIIIMNLSGNENLDEVTYRSDVIKHLPKLKQLNNGEISVREKIASGALVEWDEKDSEESDSGDEDDNDDQDDDLTSGTTRPVDTVRSATPPLLGTDEPEDQLIASSYKQLPKIESSIQSLAADMLVRSQQRLEDVARQHKRHLQQITNLRIKSKIQPIPHISKPK